MSDSRTDLPPRAVHIAAGLVGAVHDQDAAMVEHWLREVGPRYHACDMRELYAVVVALAAMVDPDQRPGQLLAWCDLGLPREPEPVDDLTPMRKRDAVVEDVEWLLSCGTGTGEIVKRLGYKEPRSLEKALERAGRRDLAAHIRPPRAGAA